MLTGIAVIAKIYKDDKSLSLDVDDDELISYLNNNFYYFKEGFINSSSY